jgi:DNA-binding transcriptional regulator YbjK
MRVLGRGGLAAVTHRAVAKEAGVSLGVVTYRHPTIDGLLDAALRHFCAAELAQLEALARSLSQQAFDADAWAGAFARAMASRISSGIEDELAGFELMLDAARRPRLRKPMRETHLAYQRIASLALAAAGSRAPDALAPILTAAITGLELHELSDPQPRFEQRLAHALRAIVVGLVATER